MHSSVSMLRHRLSCRVLAGLLAVWVMTLGPTSALAAPGALDSTFGTGGKVTTDFGGLFDWANALVRQPDGKLVIAGYSSAGDADNFALARYNPNGSLDPAFGTGGKVITDFGGSVNEALAMVLQPDGKLVAAGYTQAAGDDFALARYNSNGSLDPAFGTGGKVITDFDAMDEVVLALIQQPDGKLVAAGYTQAAGGFDFALVRYNSNGSLDSTFGTGGKVTTDFGGLDRANALVVQPDGKLVAAGSTQVGGASNFALARYNINGSLDGAFGTGGKVTTDFGNPDDEVFALVLQPDGKLVAAGSTQAAGVYDFALARYNINGSLDGAFGTGGKVTTDVFGRPDDKASALVLQPDGKLVAAGYSLDDAGYDFALARYNINGSLDTAFGAGGMMIADFGSPDDAAAALVLQPDGKLVAAGYTATVDGYDVALARFQGDGTATAARTLTTTKTSTGSGSDSPEQRTFLATDPIAVRGAYYDPNDACLGVNPVSVKFFVFNLAGQLVLGKNRDAGSAPTNTVTNTQIGTSKHQALVASMAPGELLPGAYKLVFRVQDCASTEVLVSKFYTIRVLAP